MANRQGDIVNVVTAVALGTGATNSATQTAPASAKGVLLTMNITAVGGTPTLDVKLQTLDPLTSTFVDAPGAAFAQKTTTGVDSLTIYPGAIAVANRVVGFPLSNQWRVVSTVAGTTPTFTFTLTAEYLPY